MRIAKFFVLVPVVVFAVACGGSTPAVDAPEGASSDMPAAPDAPAGSDTPADAPAESGAAEAAPAP